MTTKPMSDAREHEESASFYPCERCGRPIAAARAFALMETLEVLCPKCFQEILRQCEGFQQPVASAAYQHLQSGRLLCEGCVIKELSIAPDQSSL